MGYNAQDEINRLQTQIGKNETLKEACPDNEKLVKELNNLNEGLEYEIKDIKSKV